MKYLSVGDVARQLRARPIDISDLFYKCCLNDQLCPIVGGRRLIPPDYVQAIALELRRKGVRVRTPHDEPNGGAE